MYDKLFEPTRIGRMHLKNRVIRAPNTTLFASPKDGTVTQLLLDHYAVEAAGGVGLSSIIASMQDKPPPEAITDTRKMLKNNDSSNPDSQDEMRQD